MTLQHPYHQLGGDAGHGTVANSFASGLSSASSINEDLTGNRDLLWLHSGVDTDGDCPNAVNPGISVCHER